MAINLAQSYSKILDKGYVLKSITAPAFKGKYEVVGGTTKTFKVYSPTSQALRDYTARKDPATAAGVGNWGFQYQSGENTEQVVTATQDQYFAITIDKANAKFSRDGSLDASEFMRAQLEEQVYPTIDKYNIAALVTASTPVGTPAALTKANAYEKFIDMMTAQTNALVPSTGRVAFVRASVYALLKQDTNFAVASELTATSRRSGNYGRIDGCLIVEIPDSYMPNVKTDIVLTHESAAASIKALVDYKQGEFQESASGFYVSGRVVFEAFAFDKKKTAIRIWKNAA